MAAPQRPGASRRLAPICSALRVAPPAAPARPTPTPTPSAGDGDGADAGGQEGPRLLVPDDMGCLVMLEDPQPSPSGDWVAYVLSRPNYDANQHEKQLMLTSTAGEQSQQFTFDRPFVSSPRWSPAGDTLAFLDQAADGTTQVFVLSMAGGDSRQATEQPGVKGFAFSPDGSELALTVEDQPEEKEGEERHDKSFEVGDDHFLTEAAPLPQHVWIVPVVGGAAERLTCGPRGLTQTFGGSAFSWTPDGSALVYSSQPHASLSYCNRQSLEVVPRAKPDAAWTLDPGPSAFGSLRVSPDGKSVAYSQVTSDAEGRYVPSAIYVRPLEPGAAAVCVSSGIDRSLTLVDWSLDGQSLLASADDGSTVSVWSVPLEGVATKLPLGGVQPTGIAPTADGGVVFVGKSVDRVAEIYSLGAGDATPRRLTDHNAFTANQLLLGEVETLTWASTDGLEPNGIVTYPPDFDPSHTYPLVLVVHGGPMSASLEGFTIRNQILASAGWIVFNPNYRGSDNLGAEFQRAVIGDAGDGPGEDVMAGVAALVATGCVDETRIGLSGWSYGGCERRLLLGTRRQCTQ